MSRKAIYLHPAQAIPSPDGSRRIIRCSAAEMIQVYDAARRLKRAIKVDAVKKDGSTREFLVCNPSKVATAEIKGTGPARNYRPTQRVVWDASVGDWRVLDLASTFRMTCGDVFVLDATR